jgi:hypothetical protein
MFRTYYLIVAIGLPLLVAGCSGDASPPSGPQASEPPTRPATRASAAAVDNVRFQIREAVADAGFFRVDGCVETTVNLTGAEQTSKGGPGKPSTGPLASISVFEFDGCTQTELGNLFGETGEVVFEATNNLTKARLQATIPVTDEFGEPAGQVEVDLTWTGAGEVSSGSVRDRNTQPGLMVSAWFKGTTRPAAASGTVLLGGVNFAPDTAFFANISRSRRGEIDIVRNR